MKLTGPEIRIIRESDADMTSMIEFLFMVKKVFPTAKLLDITKTDRKPESFHAPVSHDAWVAQLNAAANAVVPPVVTKVKKAPPKKSPPMLPLGAIER